MLCNDNRQHDGFGLFVNVRAWLELTPLEQPKPHQANISGEESDYQKHIYVVNSFAITY